MKPVEILVFGASGQIGRNLLRKLTRNNFKVTALTRNIHTKGYILKSAANAGWIDIIEIGTFEYEKLNKIFKNKDICINLIGILNEKNKNSFKNIHCLLPKTLAQLSKQNNLKQFIHLSSLGVEEAIDSKYANSKVDGEIEVKKNSNAYVILKPSIVYSVDDKVTTKFMSMLSLLPIFPLYYNGATKFCPVHASDVSEVIFKVISNEIYSKSIKKY